MESRAKLIKAIIEELNYIPEKHLTTVYKMIHNFRADISSNEYNLEKSEENERIDEIKKVQEQSEQIRPDKFGSHDIT